MPTIFFLGRPLYIYFDPADYIYIFTIWFRRATFVRGVLIRRGPFDLNSRISGLVWSIHFEHSSGPRGYDTLTFFEYAKFSEGTRDIRIIIFRRGITPAFENDIQYKYQIFTFKYCVLFMKLIQTLYIFVTNSNDNCQGAKASYILYKKRNYFHFIHEAILQITHTRMGMIGGG